MSKLNTQSFHNDITTLFGISDGSTERAQIVTAICLIAYKDPSIIDTDDPKEFIKRFETFIENFDSKLAEKFDYFVKGLIFDGQTSPDVNHIKILNFLKKYKEPIYEDSTFAATLFNQFYKFAGKYAQNKNNVWTETEIGKLMMNIVAPFINIILSQKAEFNLKVPSKGYLDVSRFNVLDPCQGINMLLITCKDYLKEKYNIDAHFEGSELLADAYLLSKVEIALKGFDANIVHKNYFMSDYVTKFQDLFDLVIDNPPYSQHESGYNPLDFVSESARISKIGVHIFPESNLKKCDLSRLLEVSYVPIILRCGTGLFKKASTGNIVIIVTANKAYFDFVGGFSNMTSVYKFDSDKLYTTNSHDYGALRDNGANDWINNVYYASLRDSQSNLFTSCDMHHTSFKNVFQITFDEMIDIIYQKYNISKNVDIGNMFKQVLKKNSINDLKKRALKTGLTFNNYIREYESSDFVRRVDELDPTHFRRIKLSDIFEIPDKQKSHYTHEQSEDGSYPLIGAAKTNNGNVGYLNTYDYENTYTIVKDGDGAAGYMFYHPYKFSKVPTVYILNLKMQIQNLNDFNEISLPLISLQLHQMFSHSVKITKTNFDNLEVFIYIPPNTSSIQPTSPQSSSNTSTTSHQSPQLQQPTLIHDTITGLIHIFHQPQ